MSPTYKLTMRDLKRGAPEETVFPLTGSEIRALREGAKLSQAVFARYLHLTVDHVSKLERGAKRPAGPALVLLNVIRRKGNRSDPVTKGPRTVRQPAIGQPPTPHAAFGHPRIKSGGRLFPGKAGEGIAARLSCPAPCR